MKNKYRELTSIHTHPSDDTFSIEDIEDFIKKDAICDIMVETPSYEFSLKPNINDLEICKANIYDFSEWLKQSIGIYFDNNYDKLSSINTNEMLYLAYEEIFNKLGWEYERRTK